jgi:ribosomal protein S18 acetylase RimI-like enzyme
MTGLIFSTNHIINHCEVVIFLSTDPEFQRLGLGRMLMEHSLALADAAGKKTYIEGSRSGHHLYEKLGFKKVDMVEIDYSRFGATELEQEWIMIRDPVPKIE